jgi:hypothetical protein
LAAATAVLAVLYGFVAMTGRGRRVTRATWSSRQFHPDFLAGAKRCEVEIVLGPVLISASAMLVHEGRPERRARRRRVLDGADLQNEAAL